MKDFTVKTVDNGASSEVIREKFSLDQQGISDWLKSKNLLASDEVLESFYDMEGWARKGGETYGTSFKFSTNKENRQIFIKAIVTLSPEKSLLDWARRRKILVKNGITVSHWYHHGSAAIIEDFYPNPSSQVKFERILTIGHKLDQLGFATLKFADDIRADQNGNPFFIDFGFDLGEPSNNLETAAMKYLIRNFPDRQDEITKFYESRNLLETHIGG